MSEISISSTPNADAPACELEPRGRVPGYWSDVRNRLRYDYVRLFFLLLIVDRALGCVRLLLAPFDPNNAGMAHRLKLLFWHSNILGTDEQGRHTGPQSCENRGRPMVHRPVTSISRQ